MKKRSFKRSIISLILATLIVFSTFGFAPVKKVEAKTIIENNLKSGEILATASKKLTSSTGTLSVYLGSGHFFAKLHASAWGICVGRCMNCLIKVLMLNYHMLEKALILSILKIL